MRQNISETEAPSVYSVQTTEELYQMLLQNADRAGKIELVGDALFWMFSTFWVYAYVDGNEGYISVSKNKRHWWQSDTLLHWHPRKEEIYDQLSAIGKRGNILVIRTSPLFSDVFYLGAESEYPYSSDKKRHWGRLHYLRPQESEEVPAP